MVTELCLIFAYGWLLSPKRKAKQRTLSAHYQSVVLVWLIPAFLLDFYFKRVVSRIIPTHKLTKDRHRSTMENRADRLWLEFIAYRLNSGKNNKLIYYIKNYIKWSIPSVFYRSILNYSLKKVRKREDSGYIKERVDYYNKITERVTLPSDALLLKNHKPSKQKVYFFDTYEYTRYFPATLRWGYCPGDVDFIPPYHSIVKSRPIGTNNENSVLLNLNKIRHFIFLKDHIPFIQKKNVAIFRGKVSRKQLRIDFMTKFFNSSICDCGDIGKETDTPAVWKVTKITIREHLKYKYIIALEGNDVASNLKWIMSSNSIAVMPRPKFETWFMEGKLIPDYHYIEIADDFSDLEEKLNYYSAHTDKALNIIKHANNYVNQFKNKEREKLISLLVLDKYFRITGQI